MSNETYTLDEMRADIAALKALRPRGEEAITIMLPKALYDQLKDAGDDMRNYRPVLPIQVDSAHLGPSLRANFRAIPHKRGRNRHGQA